MTRFPRQTAGGFARAPHSAGCPPEADWQWLTGSRETWWTQHREASLNWLALGLLLAAWNAADNGAATANGAATDARRRPELLRAYAYVSVRAQRSASVN